MDTQLTKQKQKKDYGEGLQDLRMQGENKDHDGNELQIANKNYKTQLKSKKVQKEMRCKQASPHARCKPKVKPNKNARRKRKFVEETCWMWLQANGGENLRRRHTINKHFKT